MKKRTILRGAKIKRGPGLLIHQSGLHLIGRLVVLEFLSLFWFSIFGRSDNWADLAVT